MPPPLSSIPPKMSSDTPPPLSPRLAMDGFLPDDLLASLLSRGHATRAGCVLRTRDGRTYVLEDALRVLGCVTGKTDPYGYTGIVETLGALIRRGFVITSQRIALNRVAYDVEFGVLAHPLAHADETGVNARVG